MNIENLRDTSQTRGLSTAVKLDLSTRSGNVDVTTLGIDLRADLTRARSKSFVLARGEFGWLNGDRFSNQGLLHARYTHTLRARLSAEGFSQIDYDKSRRLDFRGLAGSGIRLSIWKSDAAQVLLGSSYMIEHEEYELPAAAEHIGEDTVHRWSNYLNIRTSGGARVRFAWITYAQPRFDDFGDVRVLTDATLAVDISDNVSLTNTFRARYDSGPPDGIDDLDTELSTGVRLSL